MWRIVRRVADDKVESQEGLKLLTEHVYRLGVEPCRISRRVETCVSVICLRDVAQIDVESQEGLKRRK